MTLKSSRVSLLFGVPGATKKTLRGEIAKGGRTNVGVARSNGWLLKDLFSLLTRLVQFSFVVENFLFSHLRQVRFRSFLYLGELHEIPLRAVCLAGEFLSNRNLSCRVLLALNDFQSALFAEGRNPAGDRLRPKNI